MAPTFERHVSWIKQTLNATGARTQLGLELYSVFVAAGLPSPAMRMDAMVGGGPNCPAYELVAEVTRSLVPVMEKLNIATATEVDVSSLAQRLRDEVVAAKGVVLSPGLIGSWSRKLLTPSEAGARSCRKARVRATLPKSGKGRVADAAIGLARSDR